VAAGGEPTSHRDDPHLIWDEYKYRHDLCWRLVFQITAAVVLISIVPYIQKDVAATLHWAIVALPVLGILLACLGVLRLNRELVLLRKVTLKHRELHQENYPGLSYEPEKDLFKRDVLAYMMSLVVLGVVNVAVVAAVWLPTLR